MSKADKDSVVDLAKFADQRVRVRFQVKVHMEHTTILKWLIHLHLQGGREVEGILKGFDKLDNLVLDDCTEFLRGTAHYLTC